MGYCALNTREPLSTRLSHLSTYFETYTDEKLSAEAAGQEKQGLAKVHVREAEAAAVEKQGTAEASAIREKLTAEAQGLAQKAASMKALDESGRGHEEFRMQIEKERAIALESLKVKKDIVAAQASVMAEAIANSLGGGNLRFSLRRASTALLPLVSLAMGNLVLG